MKLCFHEHSFTERRKTLCVVTSLYEDSWEVLTFVSKELSDSCSACLWNLEWVASLRLIHFPLIKWGGGQPTRRLGPGIGATCPNDIENKVGEYVWSSPPSTLVLNHWPVSPAAWVFPHIKGSHWGFLSLSSLTSVPYTPSVPKHLLDQALIPLNTT